MSTLNVTHCNYTQNTMPPTNVCKYPSSLFLIRKGGICTHDDADAHACTQTHKEGTCGRTHSGFLGEAGMVRPQA